MFSDLHSSCRSVTGHDTLRRHLHVMGLSNNTTCRKCGTEEETSVHILGECEALACLRNVYLGSFFLDPEDIRVLGVGAIWNFVKETGLLYLVQNRGHKGCVLKPRCIGPRVGLNPNIILFYSSDVAQMIAFWSHTSPILLFSALFVFVILISLWYSLETVFTYAIFVFVRSRNACVLYRMWLLL